MRFMRLGLTCILGICLLAGQTHAAPLGNSFTYQGHLAQEGKPIDGSADLRFTLWGEAAGGAQVGGMLSLGGVAVTDGLFTVSLDFGVAAFNGEARWLQIEVRSPAGGGDYTTLTPRHSVTAAPYALALPGLQTRQHATSPNLIGGFRGNTVTSGAFGATIGGGGDEAMPNRVTDDYGTISGGRGNQAGDGAGTTSNQPFATVGGGLGNRATGGGATIGGGFNNTASSDSSTVGGGRFNTASGGWSTVGGGSQNTASSYSAVGGGVGNLAVGNFSTVSGGQLNWASGPLSTVGGGEGNSASAEMSTIGGGTGNEADGQYSIVGGGRDNKAVAARSVVVGGQANAARGNGSTVGGGQSNTASGSFSTVPGGSSNQAGGDNSFAGGNSAIVRDAATVGDGIGDRGTFVWADSTFNEFVSDGQNRFLVRSSGGARFYSSANLSTGVNLAPNGGSWTSVSDQNLKENIVEVDGRDVLERLSEIRIATWNYKTQDPSIRHIGPMGQDFHAAFGVGDEPPRINTIDADGVALAAIQGLHEMVKEKVAEIEELKARNEMLEERLERIERTLAFLPPNLP